MIRGGILALLIVFTSYLMVQLFSGGGAQQFNKDYLFLSDDQIPLYQRYQSEIEEKKLILIKVQYPTFMNQNILTSFNEQMSTLKKNYQRRNISFHTYPSLYKDLIGTEINLQEHFEQHDQKDFPFSHLLGKESIIFMVLFPEDVSANELGAFLKDVEVAPWGQGVKLIYGGKTVKEYFFNQNLNELQINYYFIIYMLTLLLMFLFLKNIFVTFYFYFPALFNSLLCFYVMGLFYHHLNFLTLFIPQFIFLLQLNFSIFLFYNFHQEKRLQDFLKKSARFVAFYFFLAFGLFSFLLLDEFYLLKQTSFLMLMLITFALAFSLFWLAMYGGMAALFNGLIKEKFRQGATLSFLHRAFSFQFSSLSYQKIYGLLGLMVLIIGPVFFYSRLQVRIDPRDQFSAQKSKIEQSHHLEMVTLGIPMVDLFIYNKDHTRPLYSDFHRLLKVEQSLASQLPKPIDIFSPYQFVKKLNSHFFLQESLPEDQLTFDSLWSLAPSFIQRQYPLKKLYHLTLNLSHKKHSNQHQDDWPDWQQQTALSKEIITTLEKLQSKLESYSLEWLVTGFHYHAYLSAKKLKLSYLKISCFILLYNFLLSLYFWRKLYLGLFYLGCVFVSLFLLNLGSFILGQEINFYLFFLAPLLNLLFFPYHYFLLEKLEMQALQEESWGEFSRLSLKIKELYAFSLPSFCLMLLNFLPLKILGNTSLQKWAWIFSFTLLLHYSLQIGVVPGLFQHWLSWWKRKEQLKKKTFLIFEEQYKKISRGS